MLQNRRKGQDPYSFLEEHNPIVGVPRIRQPIRIAVPLRPVPVGIRNVPVAVRVAELRAKRHPHTASLLLQRKTDPFSVAVPTIPLRTDSITAFR